MPEEPEIKQTEPTPAPVANKSNTSAYLVTQEAERERKIKDIETRLNKQSEETLALKKQFDDLLPKVASEPVKSSNPVVAFFKEVGILAD